MQFLEHFYLNRNRLGPDGATTAGARCLSYITSDICSMAPFLLVKVNLVGILVE